MSANSKEILRGQVTLDLKDFNDKLNSLPGRIQKAADDMSGKLKNLGDAAGEGVSKVIAPLNELTKALESTNKQLDKLEARFKSFGINTTKAVVQSGTEQVASVKATARAIEQEESRAEKARQATLNRSHATRKNRDQLASKERIADAKATADALIAEERRIAAIETAKINQQGAMARQVQAQQFNTNRDASRKEEKRIKDQNDAILKQQMDHDEKILAARLKAWDDRQQMLQESQNALLSQTKSSNEELDKEQVAHIDRLNARDRERYDEVIDQRRQRNKVEVDLERELQKELQKQRTARPQDVVQREYDQRNAQITQRKPTRQVTGNQAIDEATPNIQKLGREANKAKEELAKVERQVYQLYRAGAQIAQLSFMMSAFSGALLGVFAATIKTAESFDTWTRKAYAAGKATGDFTISLEDVRESVELLSTQIGSFRPDEIAQGLYFYQAAVGETVNSSAQLNDIMQNRLLPVLKASAIAGVDVETAMRGVTSAAGEFGIGMDQIAHVTQIMLSVTQLSNAEFTDVIESFTLLGAGAAQMGMKIEEVAAVMGRLSDVNVRGGMSGRGVAQMLAGLIDPSKRAEKELESLFGGSQLLGNSWRDIMYPGGEFIGLLDRYSKELDSSGNRVRTHQGLISILADRTRGLTEDQRQQAFSALTTQGSYRALIPLISEAIDNTYTYNTRLQELYETMTNNPAQLFEDQWNVMKESVREQIGLRINALKLAVVDFGLAASHAVLPVIDAFTDLINRVREFGKENPGMLEFILRITAIATAATLAAAGLGMIVGNLLQLGAVVQLIPAALRAISGEFVLIGAAGTAIWGPILAAAVLFVAAWRNNWQGIRDAINGAYMPLQIFLANVKDIGNTALAIFDDIASFRFDELSAHFNDIAVRILSSFIGYIKQIGPSLLALIRAAMSDVNKFMESWVGEGYVWGRNIALRMTDGIRTTLLEGMRSIISQANDIMGGINPPTPSNPITPRAFGGVVQPGEVTLVGEKGPELVVLPPGSQVVPNKESMGIIANGKAVGTGVSTNTTVAAGTATIIPNAAGFAAAGGQAGTDFSTAFNQKTGSQMQPLKAGPLLEAARSAGSRFANQFIEGFNSVDFGNATSFLDDIMKNVEANVASGLFGSGAEAIEGYIGKMNVALSVTENLVNVIKTGGSISDALYQDLSNVAGQYADDIVGIVEALRGVAKAEADIAVTEGTREGLEAEKELLEDQKEAIQDKISLLEDQKRPYEEEIEKIEEVIEGLQDQHEALERQKQPYEDQIQAIDDVIRLQQRSLEPLEDALRLIELQRNALDDQVQGIEDVIQGLEDQKQVLEDQKQPYQDQIEALDAQIEALQRVKEERELAKQPLEDEKQLQQDIIDGINREIEALQYAHEQRKKAQEEALRPDRERLETNRQALDDERQVESDIAQAANDKLDARREELELAEEIADAEYEGAREALDARMEALDAARDLAEEEFDAIQDTIDAREDALNVLQEQENLVRETAQTQLDADRAAIDAIKQRFAMEEEIAASRVEQASLMGASQNVTGFLQYQQAALKKSHAGQLDPAEAALSAAEKAEKLRADAAQKVIDAQQKLIDADAEALDKRREASEKAFEQQQKILDAEDKALEKRKEESDKSFENRQKAIDADAKLEEKRADNERRRLDGIDRENQALERSINEREKANERENRNHEREIEVLDRRKKDHEDSVDDINRELDAIDRRNKTTDREIDAIERQKQSHQDAIAAIERQEKAIERQIELENRRKEQLDRELEQLNRQTTRINREQEIINHGIELENRRKERIGDEIRAIERQQELVNRQIQLEQDRKEAPQNSIDAIDKQVEAEGRRSKEIDNQIKAKDRELELNSRVLKDQNKILDNEKQRLADAEALLTWHQKISDMISEQNRKLQEASGQGGPGDPRKPQSGGGTTTEVGKNDQAAEWNPNTDPIYVAQQQSITAATALWMAFKDGIRDTMQTIGITTEEQMQLVASHLGLTTGVIVDKMALLGPDVANAMEGTFQGVRDTIWGATALADPDANRMRQILNEQYKGLIDPDRMDFTDIVQKYYRNREPIFIPGTAEIEGYRTRWDGVAMDFVHYAYDGFAKLWTNIGKGITGAGEGLATFLRNGIDDVVKWIDAGGFGRVIESVRNWLNTAMDFKISPETIDRIAGPFERLGDVFRNFSPGDSFLNFFRGIEDAMNNINLASIEDLFNAMMRGGDLPGNIFGAITDFFQNLKGIANLDNVTQFFRAIFVGGDDVARLALGFKSLTGGVGGLLNLLKGVAGGAGPFGWILTVAIDLITVIVENWEHFSDVVGKGLNFIMTAIRDNIMPVFKEFIDGTLERIGPALKNVFAVLAFIDEVIQVVIIAIGKFIEAMAPILGPLFQGVTIIIGGILDILKSLWFIFLDIIALDFGKLQEDLGHLFTGIWENLQKLWPVFVELMQQLVPTILGALGTALGFIGEQLMVLFNDVIKPRFMEFVAGLPAVWEQIKIDALAMFGALGGMIGEKLSDVWDAICSPFRKAWDELFGNSIVPDMIEGAKNWFTSLPGIIVEALKDLFTFITQPYRDAWTWISDTFFGEAGLYGTMMRGWLYILASLSTFIGVWEGTDGILGNLGTAFRWVIARAADWVGADPANGINGILSQGWENAKKNVAAFIGDWETTEGILGFFGTAFRTIKTKIALHVGADPNEGMGGIMAQAWTNIKLNTEAFIGKWEDEKGSLLGWMGWGFRELRTMVKNILGAAGSGAETLWGIFTGGLTAMANWIDTGFIGTWTINGGGILGFIHTGLNELRTQIGKFIGTGDEREGDTLFSKFSRGFNGIRDWFRDTFFSNGDANPEGSLIERFKYGMGLVQKAIEDAIGADDTKGIRKIFSDFGGIVDKVAGLFTTLKSNIDKLPGLPSWLTSLAGQFGINLGGGAAPPVAPQGGGRGGGATPLHGSFRETQGPGNGPMTTGDQDGSHDNANAIDYGTPVGTPIYSIGPGIVTPGYDGTYGNYVDLTLPTGNVFRYGHLDSRGYEGEVDSDTQIGVTGNTGKSTGPHLHFEHRAGSPGWRMGDIYDWADGTLPGYREEDLQPKEQKYVFPVENYSGEVPIPPHHGSSRSAADLFAPRGSRAFAMTSGTVTGTGSNSLGGNVLTYYGDDGRLYYNAHFDSLAGLQVGDRVEPGTVIGYVGDTGNAVGTGPHLHIGVGQGPNSIIEGKGPDGGGGRGVDNTALMNAAYNGGTFPVSGSGAGPGRNLPNIGKRPTGPLGAAYDWMMQQLRGMFGGFFGRSPNGSPTGDGGSTPGSYDPNSWGDPTPDQINARLAGTNLAGMGDTFYDIGKRHNVPVAMQMTMTQLESSNWSDGDGLHPYNNASGVTGNGYSNQTGQTNSVSGPGWGDGANSRKFLRNFATWGNIQDGLNGAAELMAKPHFGGLTAREFISLWFTGSTTGKSDEVGTTTVEDYLNVFRQVNRGLGLNTDPDTAIVRNSYRDGKWEVPNDGVKATLHAGEMVVPADFAERLREAITATPSLRVSAPSLYPTNSNSTITGDTNNTEVHYHIHVDGNGANDSIDNSITTLKRAAYVTGGQFHGPKGY